MNQSSMIESVLNRNMNFYRLSRSEFKRHTFRAAHRFDRADRLSSPNIANHSNTLGSGSASNSGTLGGRAQNGSWPPSRT